MISELKYYINYHSYIFNKGTGNYFFSVTYILYGIRVVYLKTAAPHYIVPSLL